MDRGRRAKDRAGAPAGCSRVFVAALVVLAGACPRAETPASRLPDAPVNSVAAEVAALFGLIDALGLPDPRGRPFVRVTRDPPRESDAGPRLEVDRDGFLLEQSAETFTVVHGIEPVTYRRASPRSAMRAGFVTIDLAAGLREWIAAATALPDDFHDPRIGQSAHATIELLAVVLARAADRHGLHDERERLLEIARTRAERRGDRTPRWTETIRADLATTLMWEATLSAADPEEGRPALRARFRRIVERLPDSEHAAEAAELVAILDGMIAEDEAFAAAPTDPRDPEAAIAALIHGLRDARGSQWTWPGGVSLMTEPGPGRSLLARGRAAIPALIAIVGDRRLTRTIWSHRPYHFSHRIQRYDFAAREILWHITGRSFADRAAAEAWWAIARSLSEVETLALGVRSPDEDAGEQAQRLLRLDRPRALREVAAALPTATPAARRGLVAALAADDGHESLALLRAEVRTGPAVGRHAAALALAERGVVDWVPELAAYLERPPSGATAPTIEQRRRLVEVLVERGGAAGISAASALLPRFDLVTRKMLVQEFDAHLHRSSTAAARRAAEDALAAALADDATLAGLWYWGKHGVECQSPQVREIAALMLGAHLDVPLACTWSPVRRAAGIAEVERRLRSRRPPGAPRSAESPALAPAPAPADAAGALAAARSEADARQGATLAATVRAAHLDDPQATAPERAALAGLAGRPLAVDVVIAAVERLMARDARGHLTVSVHRDGGGLGVTLRARVRNVPPETESTDAPYTSIVVRLDDRYEHSSYTVGGAMGLTEDLRRHLVELLAAPPARDAELIFDVRWIRDTPRRAAP